MIDYATATFSRSNKYQDLSFTVGDATNLHFTSEFDLIVSFNALHWIPIEQHPNVLRSVHRALKPGGRVMLEFESEGSMEELLEVYYEVANSPQWSLDICPADDITRPSHAFYQDLLDRCGFGGSSSLKRGSSGGDVIDGDGGGDGGSRPFGNAEVVLHTSRHDGVEGLLSRIRGAWVQFPSLRMVLPDAADRDRFGEELAKTYAARYPPDEDGVISLQNALMVVTAKK
jgi:trans-aconitate methyltransferase